MMLRTTIAIAAMFALTACMSQADTSAVDSAAVTFFERQSQGDDQAIYDNAAAAFRNAAPLGQLVRLNNAVRAVPGCSAPVRNPNIWHNNVSTSGHFISVVYNRTCETGPLTDSLRFQIINGQAVLLSYNVSGMALFPAAAPPAEATPPTEAAPAEPKPEAAPAGTPT